MQNNESKQYRIKPSGLFSASDPHTAPIHLRAMAYLYGIDTAPLDRARVLELGCGGGTNLRPFGLSHPESQIVGIDLDAEQVAQGVAEITRLGIGNQQLFSVELDDLLNADDIGEFDYIIVRGIFSLLDKSAKQALLSFCRDHLADTGIIALGYPIHPGSRTTETLRDALMFHSGLAHTDTGKLASARAMLAFLSEAATKKNPLQGTLQSLIEQSEDGTDTLLSLRYLQGLENPCYFTEFTELLDPSELSYVGDAAAHSELPAHWGDDTHRMMQVINPDHHKILGQQYLDFVSHRGQRISLLTHRRHAGVIAGLPDVQRLSHLRWSGNFVRARDANDQPLAYFHGGDGEGLRLKDETIQSVLDHLGFAWPFSLDFDTLLRLTRHAAGQSEEQAAADLAQALETIFTQLGDKIHLSREATPYDRADSAYLQRIPGLDERPAEAVQPSGRPAPVINLWQQEIDLTPALKACLQTGDFLANEVEDPQPDRAKVSPAKPRPSRGAIETLDLLRATGLIHGKASAWTHYAKQAVAAHFDSPIHAAWRLNVLLTFSRDLPAAQQLPAPPEDIVPPPAMAIIRQIRAARQQRNQVLAEKLADDLVARFPDCWDAWQTYAQGCIEYRRHDALLRAELNAIVLQPGQMLAYAGLAIGLDFHQQGWLAQQLLERIVRINPDCGPAWDRLGVMYYTSSRMTEAAECAERAVNMDGSNHARLCNLARIYAAQLRHQESLATYRRAITYAPKDLTTRDNYLFTALHDFEISPQALYQDHLAFGHIIKGLTRDAGKKPQLINSRIGDRPIRIGFVSGDLRNHAVAYFIEPYFESLDKRQFKLFAYQNYYSADGITERLKRHTHRWAEIYSQTDDQITQRIREDEIDILIDLSGHTAYNRLMLFARRAAPIQMSWIGYPATTGLHNMDYVPIPVSCRFGDLDAQFTEKLLYMPDRVPFKRDTTAPDINPLPMLGNGHITFGSFNRVQKLSKTVLNVWADILQAAPDARLIMGNMTDALMVDAFKQHFENKGIDAGRIDFKFKLPMNDYQKLHHEVDVLLDTFPYNGGTTTNHALWMGVPTLTLGGATLACRHGVPLLTQYGLEEFITYTVDDYIQKAIELSTAQDRLSAIRGTMRERIAQNDMSVQDAVTIFGKMLRTIWQHWCEGNPPTSMDLSGLSAD